MRRLTSQIIKVAVLGVCCIVSSVVSAQLAERAPEVLPGTTADMRTVAYWTARMQDPDAVILSSEEILARNAAYRKKVMARGFFKNIPEAKRSKLQHYYPGISLDPFDITRAARYAHPDTIRYYIDIEKKYLASQEFGNSNGVKYSDAEIESVIGEMAEDRIGDFKWRYALTVRMTQVRSVPGFPPLFIGLVNNKGRTRFDLWSTAVIKIARPLVVLHLSDTGEFAFVRSDVGYGWVKCEDIAFCGEHFGGFADPEDRCVATGDRVLLYTDESCSVVSGWFGMGCCLPLASTGKCRRVVIPVRNPDGALGQAEAWLPADADVSRGWLPYTRRNIIETAFKLLDNPYDFTGTFFGRQHESTYRDIFACFGFNLPYHGGMFTHFGNVSFVLDPEVDMDEQHRKIFEFDPFVTLMITLQDRGGHCQLLLGGVDGVPIVFDQHGYGYTDENGKELIIRRCVVDDISMPAYFLKRKLTFLVLK